MNPEQHRRAKEIFHRAEEMGPLERQAYLAEACAGDSNLQSEVERLLRSASDTPASFLEPAEPPPSTPAIGIGETVGHFRVTGQLGKGGMGEVYRATDTQLGREVAIKVLPGAVATDPERLARFEREARVLASIDHPNIAAIYSVEAADHIHFLVMQLVEGEDLSQLMQGGAIGIDDVLPIALQIAEALEAAHERGIVHRDLKPANIKVTSEGQVKVLDFGLAKATDLETGDSGSGLAGSGGVLSMSPTLTAEMTQPGVILGTAAYMSPEQARGRELDKRSDIWSFGVVVYEMLTGKRLYSGESLTDILAGIVSREPDWDALPKGLPKQVERVLRRSLCKDSKNRLRDIGDARLELASALSDPSAETPEADRPGHWGRPALMAGVLSLLVGLGAGYFASRDNQSISQPEIARLEIQLPEQRFLSLPDRAVAFSPDGRHLAYTTYGSIYLRRLDRREDTAIDATEDAVGPFFSPDSQWLGFFHQGQLKKVAVDGGAPIRLCQAHKPYGASWSEDNRIVYGQRAAGIFEVSPDGGNPVLLVKPDSSKNEVGYHGPQLLPGGRTLLFTVLHQGENWNDATIVAQNLDTGERYVLLEGGTDGRYVPTGHLVLAQGSTLQAMPLQLDPPAVEGSPIPIQEGVRRSSLWDSGASHFGFSDTGSLVYIPASPPLERTLVWVDRNGTEEALPLPVRFYQHPRLSPDGSRIVVDTVDTLDLWMYDLVRNTTSRLTTEQTHLHPVWTADGNRVIFDDTQSQSLSWKSADGAETPEILMADSTHLLTPVSITPDGAALAFEQSDDYVTYDIYILALDGDRQPRPFIVSTEFREMSPVFSPDGRWLAYVSDETGQEEVYVQPYPEADRKWLISNGGGREPLWSRDGRELFFRNGMAMMAVPVQLQPDFTAGTPEILFEGRYGYEPISAHPTYDVSLDGKRFLMVKTVGNPQWPKQLHLVLNWFEELRRLD